MPTDSRTAPRHRPPTPRRLRRERPRKALRALLAVAPAHPALCWWFAPYAARVASSHTRTP